MCAPQGTDAPICQDTRSGGLDELLASAKIGHDSLVDLASEKTFQAPDDLPFGSAGRRAACDVINGRLMVPHADDDRSIKSGVGVAVAAPVEPVPAGGHPGRGRERTRTAELRAGARFVTPDAMDVEVDVERAGLRRWSPDHPLHVRRGDLWPLLAGCRHFPHDQSEIRGTVLHVHG